MQILKPQSAVADFRKVLALEPKNETVRAQMVSTQKLIRKIEFEKVGGCIRRWYFIYGTDFQAIEVEEESPVTRCYQIIAEGLFATSFSYP